MDVNGLRCLVTGTASGIGDTVTRLLGERGATVVSLDRNKPTAEVAQHVEIDLADPRSIDGALSEIEGNFDVLANIAGVPGTFPGDLVFAVNFLGLRHLTKSMLDRLDPGASIVNVSSVAGMNWPQHLDTIARLLSTETFEEGLAWFRANTPGGNAYDFSKEVVTVYTMAMAKTTRAAGNVRINAVLPGPVETPILSDFEASMGKELLDSAKAFVGRHATPDDIAPAVVFLASRDARWINGTFLPLDGGVSGAVMSGQLTAPEAEGLTDD
jgi:NAD(P)-dependent dehydrogenase (short-subunit alcohol dehydrogenase family)